jgi:hypothetical protein
MRAGECRCGGRLHAGGQPFNRLWSEKIQKNYFFGWLENRTGKSRAIVPH